MSPAGAATTVRIFPDHDTTCRAAAEAIADLAVRSVAERDRFTWALTGGSTAATLYRAITALPLRDRVPWDRVAMFLGDERYVPTGDEDSNFRMIEESLLDSLECPPGEVHPMPTHSASPAEAARAYEDLLLERLAPELGQPPGAPPCFDLVLLGIGEDGHVASLFPESTALAERERWVVAVEAPDTSPVRDRLTVTFPVIEAAGAVVLLATGEKKARVVAEVLEDDSNYPVARVAGLRRVSWYLDAAAASGLRQHPRT